MRIELLVGLILALAGGVSFYSLQLSALRCCASSCCCCCCCGLHRRCRPSLLLLTSSEQAGCFAVWPLCSVSLLLAHIISRCWHEHRKCKSCVSSFSPFSTQTHETSNNLSTTWTTGAANSWTRYLRCNLRQLLPSLLAPSRVAEQSPSPEH